MNTKLYKLQTSYTSPRRTCSKLCCLASEYLYTRLSYFLSVKINCLILFKPEVNAVLIDVLNIGRLEGWQVLWEKSVTHTCCSFLMTVDIIDSKLMMTIHFSSLPTTGGKCCQQGESVVRKCCQRIIYRFSLNIFNICWQHCQHLFKSKESYEMWTVSKQ